MALVDGRRFPLDVAIEEDGGLGEEGDDVVTIGAVVGGCVVGVDGCVVGMDECGWVWMDVNGWMGVDE